MYVIFTIITIATYVCTFLFLTIFLKKGNVSYPIKTLVQYNTKLFVHVITLKSFS